jgi:hypothetical protein
MKKSARNSLARMITAGSVALAKKGRETVTRRKTVPAVLSAPATWERTMVSTPRSMSARWKIQISVNWIPAIPITAKYVAPVMMVKATATPTMNVGRD